MKGRFSRRCTLTFLFRANERKLPYRCANRIKVNVYRAMRVPEGPFPQTYQQNC